MKTLKHITVFCGSGAGTDPDFEHSAYELGKALAENGIGLVYGGAKIGLMGAVANGAIDHAGHAIGVLPHFLASKEIAHEKLSKLILVENMHERKMKMHELSDGIITLPGGYGTMEELFEMLTWAQLGLHQKPIGILNVNGFYNELIAMLDTMVRKGLLKTINREMLLVDEHTENLLKRMQDYAAPEVPKWIKTEEET